MRNLVLIFATLLTVYLYTHPRVETQVRTVTETRPGRVPVPAPTPTPHLYYHSPLETGPLYPGTSVTTGYYSAEPSDPRFRSLNAGAYQPATVNSPYAYGNGYPVSGGGVNVMNVSVYNGGPSAAPRAIPTPTPHFYVGRLPTR